jgi:hypothetical protein
VFLFEECVTVDDVERPEVNLLPTWMSEDGTL